MTGAARSRPSVLALRALGLGDLLTGVPALRGLRRHFPDHEIVLAGPARLREPAAMLGCVDRLLVTTSEGRAVPEELLWRGPAPDVAVDLHGNGPESRGLLEALGPGRLMAFGGHDGHGGCDNHDNHDSPGGHGPARQPDGPAWRPDEHERARWCRLLRWYGIAADPEDFAIPAPATPSPAPGAVVIHPGADSGARRWPAGRFAAVASALRERGVRVVLTAGRGEGEAAHTVARAAGLPEDAVLGGDADVPFGLLAALVARARAVVSGDTGLAHLAVALASPSVTLFGPVSPALWGPPPLPRHKVLWHPDGGGLRPGDAHGAAPDPRLLRIPVSEVLDALVGPGLVPARPSGPKAAAR